MKNNTLLLWYSINGFLLLARKSLILQFDKQVEWWSIQKNVISFFSTRTWRNNFKFLTVTCQNISIAFWPWVNTIMTVFWLMHNSSIHAEYNALIQTFSRKIMTHLHREIFGISMFIAALMRLRANWISCMILTIYSFIDMS